MLQCSVGVFWWPLSPARGVYQGRLEFVSCLGGTCLLYLATAPGTCMLGTVYPTTGTVVELS